MILPQKKPLNIYVKNVTLYHVTKKIIVDIRRRKNMKSMFRKVFQWKKPQKTPKNPKKPQNLYFCDCGKKYQDNSGLWRHKKNVK